MSTLDRQPNSSGSGVQVGITRQIKERDSVVAKVQQQRTPDRGEPIPRLSARELRSLDEPCVLEIAQTLGQHFVRQSRHRTTQLAIAQLHRAAIESTCSADPLVLLAATRNTLQRIAQEVARPEGFKPPTLGSEDRCSIR